MASADKIRNGIIDKLLTINNQDYLNALQKLIEKSSVDEDIIKLSEEQKLMLEFSDDDVKNNRVIPQDQLDKEDLEWLRSL